MKPLSINRNFYFFGILLFVFYMVMGFVLSVVHFNIGDRVYSLPTFLVWFIVLVIINLAAIYVMLKYFHHKKYSVTFTLGLVYAALSVCHYIVVLTMMTARLLEGFFRYTYPLVLISALLYALSLIFSIAGRRPWLRAAGVFVFVLGSIQLLSFILNMNTENIQVIMALQNVRPWDILASSLLPIPYIMNFLSEKRKLENSNGNIMQSYVLKGFFVITGIVVITTS